MFYFLKKLNQNPVYILESKLRKKRKPGEKLWGRVHIPVWAQYLFVISIPVLYMLINPWKYHISEIPKFPVYGIILFWLFCCYIGFQQGEEVISREVKLKTFEDLISTTMDPSEIIIGKFFSVFFDLIKNILIVSPLLIILGLFCMPFPGIIAAIISGIAYGALFISLGIYYYFLNKESFCHKKKALFFIINMILLVFFFIMSFSLFEYVAVDSGLRDGLINNTQGMFIAFTIYSQHNNEMLLMNNIYLDMACLKTLGILFSMAILTFCTLKSAAKSIGSPPDV